MPIYLQVYQIKRALYNVMHENVKSLGSWSSTKKDPPFLSLLFWPIWCFKICDDLFLSYFSRSILVFQLSHFWFSFCLNVLFFFFKTVYKYTCVSCIDFRCSATQFLVYKMLQVFFSLNGFSLTGCMSGSSCSDDVQ